MSVALPGTAPVHRAASQQRTLVVGEVPTPVDLRTDVIRRRGALRIRRAKIVCTLGPSTESPEAIRSLVEAGMDVARLNFSHGSKEQHLVTYRRVREAAQTCGRSVGVMADLQGPKVRLGRFAGGSAVLERGALFTVTAADGNGSGAALEGSSRRATTSYMGLPRDVSPGDSLLIDDGRVRLRALESIGNDVVCTVIDGGVISDHKGITLPGVPMRVATLSEKDADDLRFALEMGADMVALSFVRGPEDIEPVHGVMDAYGRRVPVIAKLERQEAVDRLPEIVEAFDGLVVARGDLGVETPLEQLPMVQKRAVRLARESCKPVIVATQMLESMTHQTLPTRAEVCDVANAVLDGADAMMLSAETSVGALPLEAVRMMADIIVATERERPAAPRCEASRSPAEAIAAAAAQVAASVGARALVVFTETGMSARRVAGQRRATPTIALTSNPAVRCELTMTWGVETFVVASDGRTDEMIGDVLEAMLELGQCDPGDLIVSLSAAVSGGTGCVRTLRIHAVGR